MVEGVQGSGGSTRRLDAPFAGRAAVLSPLDRLVLDRKRMAEIFEFDYQLEMYKPAAQRRWGYYALPILYGDRLVGSSTPPPTAGRRAAVDAVHQDVPFTKAMPRRSTRRSTASRRGSDVERADGRVHSGCVSRWHATAAAAATLSESILPPRAF